MVHGRHAQLAAVRQMNGEGHEGKCVDQFADVFFHKLSTGYAAPRRKAIALRWLKSFGTVNLPQEAFIEVLKEQEGRGIMARWILPTEYFHPID